MASVMRMKLNFVFSLLIQPIAKSDWNFDSIQLYREGVTKSFAQWTRDFVSTYYPYVGQRTYRVPAIHFNQQRLVSQKELSAILLHPPEESNARGEVAHTVVLENVEHLSHSLQKEKAPLFIISTFNYDNYLHRVQPPPPTKDKENRPRRKPRRKITKQPEASKKADPQDDAPELPHALNRKEDGDPCKEDMTRRRDGDHRSTADGESVSSTTEPQAEEKKSHDQNVKSLHDIRQNSLEPTTPQKECSTPGDGNENKIRSPATTAEHVLDTNSNLPSQHSECGSQSTPESGTRSDKSKSADSSFMENLTLTEVSSPSQHSSQEPNEIKAETHAPTPAVTPPKENKKKKKKSQKLTPKDKPAPQALERLDAGNQDLPPTPSRPPQQAAKPQLPRRPKDMTEKGQRGDIDVVLVHPLCGVILMEVKATGMPHPQWQYSDQEIVESVLKAVEQLLRGREVFQFIMADISAATAVTLVVALPFVSRRLLAKVLEDLSEDLDVVFLCQDDLVSGSGQTASCQDMAGMDTTPTEARTSQGTESSMLGWWRGNICPRGRPLSLDHMQTIVGRVCGLLSIVSVWTKTKPRVEVRTAGQAISEAAERISDIVLLPQQANLLAQPLLTRLCLTGPMGSGKTLLLQLKGRQWLQEGRRVIVLNVRTSGLGRPAGHVMEEALGRSSKEEAGGSVERYDLATKGLDMAAFCDELQQKGPTDQLCFIMDELTHFTFPLLQQLLKAYPQCYIWCVAMFVRQLPSGFRHCRLGVVLRSPPSVQLLLRELDLNPVHADVYSIRSAARGLPCEGPPIIFLHHQQHDPAIRHHDCVRCADEVVEVLQDTLGLKLAGTGPQDSTNTPAPHRSKRGAPSPKAVEAKSLSFRDILLLVCVPLGYYEIQDKGLWSGKEENLFMFCKYLMSCSFFSRLKSRGVPMKIVTDNTSREIAFPPEDEIIVTDVMGVQSLERKVVIYLPGGPMLQNPHDASAQVKECRKTPPSPAHSKVSNNQGVESEESCSRNVSVQNPASASPPRKGDQEPLPPIAENADNQNTEGSNVDHTASKTHVVIREADSAKEDGHQPASKDIKQELLEAKRLFGNMIVDDPEAEDSSGQSRRLPVPDHRVDRPDIQLRMGMDLRGDSPMLLSALEDAKAGRESGSAEDEVQKDFFQADVVFPTQDVSAEAGNVEVQCQRVRQALSCLSMDDQDWLFMGAARCLSQLIVVVPSQQKTLE